MVDKQIATLFFASLLTFSSCFTPPKIIYGGWVPILPGHPFYFGPVRQNSYQTHHTSSQSHYTNSNPVYSSDYHSSDQSGYSEYQTHSNQAYDHPSHYEQTSYPAEVHPMNHYQGQTVNYEPSSGKDHSKEPYSYYPHHSAYEKPSHTENIDVKPVYIEIPRKPYDAYENPRNAPVILPDVSNIRPQDLKVIDHGGQTAYLKITSVGQIPHDAIKHVDQIKFDKTPYHTNSQTSSHVHLIQPSRLRYQDKNSVLYSSPQSVQPSYSAVQDHEQTQNQHYGNVHPPMNVFRGTSFPIEAPEKLQRGREQSYSIIYQNNAYNPKENYVSQTNDVYQSNNKIKPGDKYVTVFKGPTAYSVLNQEKVYSQQQQPRYNQLEKPSNAEMTYYKQAHDLKVLDVSKPMFSLGGYQYDYLPKSKSGLAKALKNSLLPKMLENYFHKSTKIGGLYQEPAVLANIQGTPALVEREVAIVHVPVSRQADYPDDAKNYQNEDLMYARASSPHVSKIKAFRNVSANATGNNSNDMADKSQYIYVGFSGLNADDSQSVSKVLNNNNKYKNMSIPKAKKESKQVFHAYYAPFDHIPPKGYQKMSIKEFETLFHNAEIQIMRRDSKNSK